MLRKLIVGVGAMTACAFIMPVVADEAMSTGTNMQPAQMQQHAAMQQSTQSGMTNHMDRRDAWREKHKEHEEMMRKRREEWREHRHEEMREHHHDKMMNGQAHQEMMGQQPAQNATMPAAQPSVQPRQ